MSADARMRKAWVRWVEELELSSSTLAAAIKNSLSVRMAFEAGYRSKRRANAEAQKLVNKC